MMPNSALRYENSPVLTPALIFFLQLIINLAISTANKLLQDEDQVKKVKLILEEAEAMFQIKVREFWIGKTKNLVIVLYCLPLCSHFIYIYVDR